MASTTDAAAFYTTFQSLKADATSALAISASEAAPKLAALRSALAEARPTLPPYDQRSYDLQIRDLETRMNSLKAKPKKFAFKRATPSASATPTPSTSSRASPAPPPTREVPGPQSTTYTLSNSKGRALTPSDFGASGIEETYTLTLSDLEDCVVDLRSAAALTSLHARGLRRCVVLAPAMGGSAMLSDLEECVVVLGAQQFRLHTSTKSILLLHVASLPVIEGCKGVRFGPYPFRIEEKGESRHEQVQDFDWVRSGPSPHWSLVPEAQVQALGQALAASPTPSAPSLLTL